MDMKRLDYVQDRELIEAYWTKLNANDLVDGRVVANTSSFK